MIVRYETYCGGRLLRVIEQVDVSGPPSRRQYVDGRWSWEVDRCEVPQDVASAMLAQSGESVRPAPSEPLVIS